MKEPIGEIDCPLCKRAAELHASAERPKLDPESPDGKGKPAYPRKFFVVCPPVAGYRGCGTILANGAGAQGQLMEHGRLFGPDGKPPPKKQPAPPPAVIVPTVPTPPPAKVASNPFRFW